jgi:7-alpha-hydroxysteroid dehydrogenase
MLLEGKTALVYGGAGAVGGAVAAAYAREGAKVIVAGRTAATLEAKAAQLRKTGGSVETAIVDATEADAVECHLNAVVKGGGHVDIMFNAIGWTDTQGEPLTEMSLEKFIACPNIALTTWFVTGTALAKHMGAHGGGVILGITANAAREAYTNMGGFGVACAAVEHFLHHLAVENGPSGVRVCNLRSAGSPDAPGVREAFMLHAKEKGISLAEFERDAARNVPLRHLPSLAEVADVAVLMALPLARAMTNTSFNVTCGAQGD